jgi:hypothetical protein
MSGRYSLAMRHIIESCDACGATREWKADGTKHTRGPPKGWLILTLLERARERVDGLQKPPSELHKSACSAGCAVNLFRPFAEQLTRDAQIEICLGHQEEDEH